MLHPKPHRPFKRPCIDCDKSFYPKGKFTRLCDKCARKRRLGKRKINNRSKMQRTNSKVKAWLTKNGYENIYFFPHGRFQKDYNILGQGFDGIAIHKNKIVFFQCKSNCKATKKRIEDYNKLSEIFNIECLWFNSIDRKPLEINNIDAEKFLITSNYKK